MDKGSDRTGRSPLLAITAASILLLNAIPSTGKRDIPSVRLHLCAPTAQIEDRILLERQITACAPELYRKDTVTLRFLGDVMLHQAQIDNTAREDGTFDFSAYFKDIRKDLLSADLSVANLEFTLSGEPYTGYPSFSAPDAYAEYLADCGIDVFLTANNHILDKGIPGLVRTLGIYRGMERDRGVRFTGSAADRAEAAMNNPLFISLRGMRIALLNFTYGTNVAASAARYPGTNLIDKEEILEAIARAEKKDADLIIALPHWGTEYQTTHSAFQEETAGWLADHGVDLIVGAHPHVVQDIGHAGKSRIPVVYSLGNAVSNMSAPGTQIGMLLTVQATRDGTGQVRLLPLRHELTWSSLPGRYTESHKVLKIKEKIGHRNEWIQKYEYDKMISAYYRISKETGLYTNEENHYTGRD